MKSITKVLLLIGTVSLSIVLATCLMTGYAVLSVLTSGIVWILSKAGLMVLYWILGGVVCRTIFKIIFNR